MENERSYGVRIKLIRDVYGWNQDKFAEKTGVSVPTVSRYETNATIPDLDFVKALFFKLNVNPLWFFMDEGDVIVDTKFQLSDDFEDMMEHFYNSFVLRQLFNQVMALKRKNEDGSNNEDFFYQWHELVNGMKEILIGQKTERQKNVERQRMGKAKTKAGDKGK